MITVVSGLPRSGTSLVMQMLRAGGHPILSDDLRPPDVDNPCGYLEYSKVRAIERDNSWLATAEGQAVKIVSPLLIHLPLGFEYRVIFVRRDMNEVLRSQEQMLKHRHQPSGSASDAMARHFERHLLSIDEWLRQRTDIRVLHCQHATLIGNPLEAARNLASFLNGNLNLEAMAKTVDPTLYRQRSAQTE